MSTIEVIGNGDKIIVIQDLGIPGPSGTGGGSSGSISLITGVTGVLPIGNGGTNSSTSLVNNRIIVSQSGQLREASALIDGQLLIGKTGAAPSPANITGSGSAVIVNGSALIQISVPIASTVSGSANATVTLINNNYIVSVPPSGASTGSTDLTNQVKNILPTTNGGTNSSASLINNQVIYSQSGQMRELGAMLDGQVVIGTSNGAPVIANIVGSGLAVISNGSGSIRITVTPQTVSTASTSLLNQVKDTLPILNGGTNSSTTLVNNQAIFSLSGQIKELGSMGDGQIIIGLNGGTPVITNITGSGAATITNGSGSIRITVIPQSGSSTGSTSLLNQVKDTLPVLSGGTNSSTSLTNNQPMFSLSGQIKELGAMTDGQVVIGLSGGIPVIGNITGSGAATITNGSGLIRITVVPSSSAAGSTSLLNQVRDTLPILNGGTNSSTTLTNNQLLASLSGQIKELGAMLDGQIVIGKTGSTPVIANLTGSGGAIISNGSGSIIITVTPSLGGNVIGSTTSVNDAIARYDGVTGLVIQNSGIVIDDLNNVTGFNQITINSSANQIIFGGTSMSTTTLLVSSDAISNRVLSIPATSGSSQFVMTTSGAQTISGGKTWTGSQLWNSSNSNARSDISATGSQTALSGLISNVRIIGATTMDLHGIGQGSNGRFLYLYNQATTYINILNQSASATAANRIKTPNAATVPLMPDGSAFFIYDSGQSLWVLTQVFTINPISLGGTNSSASIVSNRMVVSSAGMLVEGTALTDGQIFIGKTGESPLASNITSGQGIAITNGSGSITLSLGTQGKKRGFGITIDGGGNPISAGTRAVAIVPYSGTITQWTILDTNNSSSSIVIDIAKRAYATYPPAFPTDKITGSTPPTLTTSAKNQGTSSSSWVTSVTAGDVMLFTAGTITLCQKVTVLVEMDVL